jgi:CHAT domain-containing protein
MLNNVGNLGQWLSEKSKTWKDVQESLNNGEIAIEFCYAPQTERFPDPDVQFNYIAFVIRKDYDYPKLVSLENINRVDSVIDDKKADELFINELYASDKTLALYKMLWEKLTPYLKGIKTVYYSPSGQLSNVNFDVIRDEAGVMLNERYTMCRVSSTAKISSVKASRGVSYQSSALYGNIKYDESMDAMAEASSAYDEYSGTEIGSELALRSENERGKWGPIPSTKKEIENIYRLFKGKGILVSVFDSIAANEESFKSLHRRSPDILHLATHGFVIDTPQKAEGNKFVATTNIYSQKDSYLMWAGLMLAGGNNIWQGRFNLTNVEDGILTADEISRLDLSNTKLVVLSACETARGKVDPVDGVYGLQRAFKLAGVQTIVMSLWKVQDDATAMLMTQFYTYLTNGMEKHQALWTAMMDVRKKYKDPYYWAGFVMLD